MGKSHKSWNAGAGGKGGGEKERIQQLGYAVVEGKFRD